MGNCGSKSGKYRVNQEKKKKERNDECEQASVYPTSFVEGPPAPMIGKHEFQEKLLDAQNIYRRKHGSPRLTLNLLLSEEAQRWATYLSSCQVLKSTSEKCVGENLALRGVNKSPQFIADLWYNEVKDYDYSRPGFTTATKNFTQLVWRDSTQFGVGVAYDEVGSMYVVARYSPPGNISKPGCYDDNVKQPTTNTREDHVDREVEDMPKTDVHAPASFPVDRTMQKDDPTTKTKIVDNRVMKKNQRDRFRDSLYDNDDDDDDDCVDFKFDDDTVAKKNIRISKCESDNAGDSCPAGKRSSGGCCDVVSSTNDDRIEKKEEPPVVVKADSPVVSRSCDRVVVSSYSGGFSSGGYDDDGGCSSGGGGCGDYGGYDD